MAPSTSASTTRSRSDPDGRSNTIHSSGPSRWRTSQLDRPSANSRIPSGSVETSGPRKISSWVPGSQVAGSVEGATTTPELTTRRSWTWGRRARSISSSSDAPERLGGIGAVADLLLELLRQASQPSRQVGHPAGGYRRP